MGKYKKFSETRAETIILDEWVEMTWTPNNKKYYESLGYKYTKTRERFMVKSCDLPPGSQKIVSVMCPICKRISNQKYQDITKTGHTLCAGCANIMEMSGIRIGRLVFTELNMEMSKNGVMWWDYICDCGNTGTIRRSNVIAKNHTKSCGCLAEEVVGSIFGENHYNWNPQITDEQRQHTRRYPEYKQWVKDVYERDQYTCQVCGDSRGGNLQAHHLYSYTHYPKKRLKLENGICLCETCHNNFHVWLGGYSVVCTKGDFDRWLKDR